MKEHLNWFLSGMVICFIALLFLNKCEKKPISNSAFLNKDSIKQKIDTIKVEVIKLKEAKAKIVYHTKFDTLATIDTVFIELIKCDSIVKIDSNIIQDQDTIIFTQDELVNDLNIENDSLKKKIKKQKRKLILTKILTGAIILITIFVAK